MEQKEWLPRAFRLSSNMALAMEKLTAKEELNASLDGHLMEMYLVFAAMTGAFMATKHMEKDENDICKQIAETIPAFEQAVEALELAVSDKAEDILKALDILATVKKELAKHFAFDMLQHKGGPGHGGGFSLGIPRTRGEGGDSSQDEEPEEYDRNAQRRHDNRAKDMLGSLDLDEEAFE